jgi:hypothetical protein
MAHPRAVPSAVWVAVAFQPEVEMPPMVTVTPSESTKPSWVVF